MSVDHPPTAGRRPADVWRGVTVALVASLLTAAAAAAATFKQGTVAIILDARRVALRVEVADTPASRAQGLMFRRHLDENAGMLFIFDATGSYAFWMKNTLIPLSIAFIDERWRIVDIKDMPVAPDPEQGPFNFYASSTPFRYALEVNQGFFRRQHITLNARVIYTPR